MEQSESITESVPPIDTLSTCFGNFPVALNVHCVVSLYSSFLNTDVSKLVLISSVHIFPLKENLRCL